MLLFKRKTLSLLCVLCCLGAACALDNNEPCSEDDQCSSGHCECADACRDGCCMERPTTPVACPADCEDLDCSTYTGDFID